MHMNVNMQGMQTQERTEYNGLDRNACIYAYIWPIHCHFLAFLSKAVIYI